MSIRSAEFTPPTLIPNGCRNCGGPCYIHTTDSTGLHQVKCGRGLEAACGYRGPFASDKDEAIRLHNALCRPNPETQAVAPIELFMCEIPRLTLKPGHPYIFGVDPECPKCAEYLSGSPVEAVPVSALEKLVEELRADNVDRPCYCAHCTNMRHSCADRLSAVIRGTKT